MNEQLKVSQDERTSLVEMCSVLAKEKNPNIFGLHQRTWTKKVYWTQDDLELSGIGFFRVFDSRMKHPHYSRIETQRDYEIGIQVPTMREEKYALDEYNFTNKSDFLYGVPDLVEDFGNSLTTGNVSSFRQKWGNYTTQPELELVNSQQFNSYYSLIEAIQFDGKCYGANPTELTAIVREFFKEEK